MDDHASVRPSRPDPTTREADHRIANHLALIGSLVRQKASASASDDHRRFLMDVAGRIDTVARLHRVLSSVDGDAVPLARYLAGVCDAMSAVDDGRLILDLDCPEEVRLAPDTALSVGLTAAELISNAIKYAHPTGLATRVSITVTDEGDALAFAFEDDGIGFPENFDPHASDSVGMRVVHSLADRLGGRCQWTDSGIGLKFVCRFPAARLGGANGR